MNCIVCKAPFSASDIEMIQVDNVKVCIDCEINTVELHVKYDGTKDLLEHLKEEVPARVICSACDALEVELEKISFGNPIEGYTRCKKCNVEDILYMYLEMV